jgi:hypothetical protein
LVWLYQTTRRHRPHSFPDRSSIKTFLTVLTSGLKRVGTCNCTHHNKLTLQSTAVTICTTCCAKKYSFYLRGICKCFVWISEQTAIISLYSINWLVFITETQCVYCVVRTRSLYNATFCPYSVFMCFVWIWEQTAIISLYSINWLVFITESERVYYAVRAEFLNIISVIVSLLECYNHWDTSLIIHVHQRHRLGWYVTGGPFWGCVGLFLPRSIQSGSHGWCCPIITLRERHSAEARTTEWQNKFLCKKKLQTIWSTSHRSERNSSAPSFIPYGGHEDKSPCILNLKIDWQSNQLEDPTSFLLEYISRKRWIHEAW